MPKVLLLTASFGEGHNQAARAVAEALERDGVTVKVVDYTDWLHPALRSFAKFSLMQGVQKVPTLYGLFYRSMSRIQPSSSIQKQLNHLGMTHMKECLSSFEPDAVASTFPTPTGVLSELRGLGVTKVPNAAILTDYTAHGQWVHEHTDVYFVAAESVKRELLQRHVPASKILVTGIPVRSKFDDLTVRHLLAEREGLRLSHGFKPETPLILLMGGGAGLLADVPEWEDLIGRTEAQVAVICGRNTRLYKRLQHLHSDRVRILGYTNRVAEWMAMSDLIVTKPGGITVTEALAMELPMLLFRPIPGQEEGNAEFMVRIGAAHLAADVKAAEDFIKRVVGDPSQLQVMRNHVKEHDVRGAAERISNLLHRLARGEQVTELKVRV